MNKAVGDLGTSGASSSPVEISLPMAPSVNTAYRAVRGRLIRSKKYNEWRKIAGPMVSQDLLDGKIRQFGEARLKVTIELRFNSKRKADIDNRVKATLDLLQSCLLFEDDSQIDELCVKRGIPAKKAWMLITIEEL